MRSPDGPGLVPERLGAGGDKELLSLDLQDVPSAGWLGTGWTTVGKPDLRNRVSESYFSIVLLTEPALFMRIKVSSSSALPTLESDSFLSEDVDCLQFSLSGGKLSLEASDTLLVVLSMPLSPL